VSRRSLLTLFRLPALPSRSKWGAHNTLVVLLSMPCLVLGLGCSRTCKAPLSRASFPLDSRHLSPLGPDGYACDAALASFAKSASIPSSRNVQFSTTNPKTVAHGDRRDYPSGLAHSALASKATGFPPLQDSPRNLPWVYRLMKSRTTSTRLNARLLRADDPTTWSEKPRDGAVSRNSRRRARLVTQIEERGRSDGHRTPFKPGRSSRHDAVASKPEGRRVSNRFSEHLIEAL